MSQQIVRLVSVLTLAGLSACSPQQLNRDPAPPRSDYEYCAQLSYLYQRYFAGTQNSTKIPGDSDLASQVAVAQCEQGNTAAGIPVLERRLRANGFTLPARP